MPVSADAFLDEKSQSADSFLDEPRQSADAFLDESEERPLERESTDFVEPPPMPQFGKPEVLVEGSTRATIPASLDIPDTGKPVVNVEGRTLEPDVLTSVEPGEWAFDPQRPLVNPEMIRAAVDIGTATLPRDRFSEGVRRGVTGLAAGMTSPESIAVTPAFAVPFVGPALAMGLGAKSLGAGAGRTVAGLEAGDAGEVGEGLVETGMGGLMTLGGAAGARPRPAIPPHIIETIAKADAIGLKRAAQAYADTVKQSQRAAATTAVETKPTEVTSAEAIRSDQGQVRGEGPRPEVVPEISGENLQQPAPIPREPARAQGGEEGQILLIDRVAAMTPEQFVEATRTGELKGDVTGVTGVSIALGKTMQTPEGIARLRELEAAAESEWTAFRAAKNVNALSGAGGKKGFFTEAIEGATGAIDFKKSDPARYRELMETGKPENWEVTVQAPRDVGTGEMDLGSVQIVDTSVKAENVKSPTVESLRAAGMDVPDFSKLSTGKYTWKEAIEKTKDKTVPLQTPGKGTIPADSTLPPNRRQQQVEMAASVAQPPVTEVSKPTPIDTSAPQKPISEKGGVANAQKEKAGEVRGEGPLTKPLPEPAGPKAGGEQPTPAASQAVQLGAAESKLAEVVNQTIEQSSPTRLGVSPAATMRPMDVVLGAPDLRSISPAVEARWQQAVKGTENIIDKVKRQADEAWKSVTREYADLPPREFPAEIDILRRQRASPNASARTTVDVLKGITHNLGPKQYGVFNRVALLEDLVKDVEAGKYATGQDLPFGYKDAGELTADLNKFRAVAESTPQIKAALERRQEFMDSMRATLVERGFLPESVLSDPRYFHHQVLLYMAEKNAPAGSRSFRDWFSGWQKKRTGSSLDYNRQYVEAEAEVLADAFNKFTNQDLHGEMQGIADIASQLKEVHGAEWRQHIPKSYTTWQPKRGNIFYQVQTVAERVMDRYLSGLGDILPSEFKEALAVGGRRQEWVIPKPLAKVLDNIAPRPDNWIGRLATTAQNSWKRYILLNPLRAAKYNLNNLSGDLDFLFAAQPKIFKEFKGAAPDMWGFHVKGKSAVGDIKEAMQDGVIGSGWRASELPDIARSDYFNWLTGEKPKIVDRYWNWIGKRSDAREDTGRMASYRFAKKEWEAGRPFYGASVPADVNALATPRLKAAKVAREILIDYGRGTEFSNFTRQKLVPFFKWMEGNFVRYQQLIRNVPEHEGAGPRVAGIAGKKAATLGLRMAAAYGIINLWNHMFFPKEEEELGEGRNQLHLILGRDDQGNVQTIRFQGALSDLLGWVGGEDLPQDVKDLATGKASVGDKMEDAYEAGISRAVNASLPFPKTAAEIGLGRSFYPNALQPRPVRDKAEHAAGLFSLKPVYQWLAGKPHKPLRQEIANLISYTTDPGEAAYNTTRHMAGEWLEEHGEERASVIPGKRSNALYYYKQALRYKDQATAQKFLDEYNKLGGKREGLTQSIKASAPLSMLGNNRKAFLDSLSPQEQEAVRRAEEWYRRVYARPSTPNPNP